MRWARRRVASDAVPPTARRAAHPAAHPAARLATGASVILIVALGASSCEWAPALAAPRAPQEAISDADFVALIARISEEGGYFDTDNLISNESGYLNVMDALEGLGLHGGAYVGVGPDQNYSYIAQLRPAVAFITDVRRDNLLHHLLLKTLIERAPTRVEFLAGLHGRAVPADVAALEAAGIEEIVGFIDATPVHGVGLEALHAEVATAVGGIGVPITDADLATIRRFHQTFIDAGMGLRFTSYGRPPQAYYPTYRQLTLETDIDGDRASYLSSPERYRVVRELHLANRIIPVVGDMAGPSALEEMGRAMREMGTPLTAFYVSNVENYLWRGSTFERWRENLRSLPADDGAVVIRSFFPNAGGRHPSAVQGYYATQTLQPVSALVAGEFRSYWESTTRGAVDLRAGIGASR